MASVATAASALPDPSALKSATWRRSAPTSTDTPMIPFRVIITAAKTVSRASVAVSSGSLADTISVTISATSMTVTATASTSDPNGSPTRWATTSAWCTAASTAPARIAPTTTTSAQPRSRPQVGTSTTTAPSGTAVVQGTAASRRT